jgi:hypothetical protein
LSRPEPKPVNVDYRGTYEQAEKLKGEAESALIYQDEEKARKSLGQAISLLDQVAASGDWGIKALKLKKEIEEQLATLEKAKIVSNVEKIWTIPQEKGALAKIALNKNLVFLLSDKWAGEIDLTKSDFPAIDYYGTIVLNNQKIWLFPLVSQGIIITPQDKSYYRLDFGNRQISEKNNLENNFSDSYTCGSSFENNLYFFDPGSVNIKQFALEENKLIFKRDWLKPEIKADLEKDPLISMAVDGSIFAVTQSGKILRFSGGKKSTWQAEDLTAPPSGGNIVVHTKPNQANLYVLDPTQKRIAIYEKEGGKIKSQIQNLLFAQTRDFQVDEVKKEIYFITLGALFRLKLE